MLSALPSFSQYPIFINHGTENGLPTNETYDLYQDTLGYIWITSDRGLIRYDGLNFKIYNTNDGLPHNVIFDFYEESKTKVWVSTSENELYYFNPTQSPLTFHPLGLNDTISAIGNSFPVNYIKSFKTDGRNYFLAYTCIPGYLKIAPDNTFKHIYKHGKESNNEDSTQTIYITKNGIYQDFYTPFVKNFIVEIADLTQSISIKTNIDLRNSINKPTFNINQLIIEPTRKITMYNKSLIIIKRDTIEQIDLGVVGLKLTQSHKKDKYFISSRNGLIVLDKNLTPIAHYLKGFIISSFLEDNNGGYWITTIGKGIYRVQNPGILKIDIPEDFIPYQSISKNNFLLVHDKLGIVKVYDSTLKNIYNQNSFGCDTRRNYFWSTDTAIAKYTGGRHYKAYHNSTPHLKIFLCALDSSEVIREVYGFSKAFIEFNQLTGEAQYHKHTELNFSRITPVINNDSLSFVTSNKGLYLFNQLNMYSPYRHTANPVYTKPCKYVEQIGSNYIVTTKLDGLYLFNDSTTLLIKLSDGLIDQQITDVQVQNDTTFWISSFKGLNKIIISKDLSDYNIYTYNKAQSGILSNDISSLCIYRGDIYITSKAGVCYFDPDLISTKHNATFILDSIHRNNTVQHHRALSDSLAFKAGQDVVIYFSIIDFNDYNLKTIEYSLSQDSIDTWKLTNPNSIALSNMSSGEYILKIRDKTNNEILYSTIINVPKAYWQRWYFILFCILGLLFLISLIVKYAIYWNNKVKQRELDTLKLEIKALSAQMNPHFTFNTLNSIQHYLIQNDKIGGMQYLNDYASLMRQSLEFSRLEYITLQEEIDFLKMYCELERKRFESAFSLNFDLRLKTNVNHIYFPALILQPLIENAIIHGINHVSHQGIITVKMTESKTFYDIEVSDNGIGFLNSSPTKKHKSLGLKILEDRLTAYNGKNSNKLHVKIDFLNNENKSGTIIRFKLSKEAYVRNQN